MNLASLRGFTLAEMLVVAAILGLLSSIILVRTRHAQFEAYDSAIQQTFDTLRARAEVDKNNDGNYAAVCQESGGGSGNSILSATGDYGRINENIKSNNGGVDIICNESSASLSFAAWSPLRAEPGTFWCIDSKFNVKKITASPPVDSVECP